jgi:membrane-associated phospholipid phosphatase
VADSRDTGDSVQARPPAGVTRFHPPFALAGTALLVLAGAFAALVAAHPGPMTMTADRTWLAVLQRTRDPFLTEAAKVLSLIGGPTGGTVIVVIVAAFLWFARRQRVGAVFLAATLAVTSSASQLIKHLVLRPRPPDGLVHADIGSFPSGHVITTLAVGTALALVLSRPGHRRVPLAVAAAAALVMIWCRTYLGEHWLSDTLESVLVAGGIMLLGWAFAGRLVDGEAAR